MANEKGKSSPNKKQDATPGSSAEAAKSVGGRGDFGVPENDVAERTYTSKNTRRSDPGAAPQRSGAQGTRTSGAGGNNSGPGSSSGGDLDSDIVGVGTGGGIAASGKIHESVGPDDATGTSQDFASGPPAKTGAPEFIRRPLKGTVVQPADDRTTSPQGADASAHREDDDSFAGEISSDEATGRNDSGD